MIKTSVTWDILYVCVLKLSTEHRVVILGCMERIIRQSIDDLDAELAVEIIKQASIELTKSKVSVTIAVQIICRLKLIWAAFCWTNVNC